MALQVILVNRSLKTCKNVRKTNFSFAMRHSIFIYKNQVNFKTLEEVKIPSTNNKNIGSRTLRYMVTVVPSITKNFHNIKR